MKSRVKEQGSALHIVLVVVLVIAVLGLLGFVLWQNFVNKPTTNTTTQPSSDTTYLTIDQFGVKIPYDKADDTYSINSVTVTTADVKSKNADEACGRSVSIGYILHYKVNERLPADYPGDGGKTYTEYLKALPSVTIGDDFYALQSPQNACADPSTEAGAVSNALQVSASVAFQAAFEKLEKN